MASPVVELPFSPAKRPHAGNVFEGVSQVGDALIFNHLFRDHGDGAGGIDQRFIELGIGRRPGSRVKAGGFHYQRLFTIFDRIFRCDACCGELPDTDL